MIDPGINRDAHDTHLYVMNCDLRKLFHDNAKLSLVTVVAVDCSRVKTVVQNLLLVTPMQDVGLRAVGFSPTWLLNPKVVAFGSKVLGGFLDSKVLKSSDS